jgi:hypothetical protein
MDLKVASATRGGAEEHGFRGSEGNERDRARDEFTRLPFARKTTAVPISGRKPFGQSAVSGWLVVGRGQYEICRGWLRGFFLLAGEKVTEDFAGIWDVVTLAGFHEKNIPSHQLRYRFFNLRQRCSTWARTLPLRAMVSVITRMEWTTVE